jgi:hypothetical protein
VQARHAGNQAIGDVQEKAGSDRKRQIRGLARLRVVGGQCRSGHTAFWFAVVA